MMQASGTSEALRTLIDSSLPRSIKAIISNRGLFGPAIFSIAINIMASFVHNEPTSLTILQECGIPQAFYDAIDKGIESANEVVAAVPSAIGALCLNQTGLDELGKRESVITRMFEVLISERHTKTLGDKENATYLGASVDELIRHHPSLKDVVFKAIKQVMNKIVEMGNEYVIPPNEAANYGLVSVVEEVDVEMKTTSEDATTSVSVESGAEAAMPSPAAKPAEEGDTSGNTADETSSSHPIVTYIDIACRVRICSDPSLYFCFFLPPFSSRLYSHLNSSSRDFSSILATAVILSTTLELTS